MESPRPSRWRRGGRAREALVRRMLLAGAIVGIAVGLVLQPFVGTGADASSDIEWLIRLSLVLPGVIFVAWWLLFPIPLIDANQRAEAGAGDEVDVSQRLERIESTFDSAAVPSVRRRAIVAVPGITATQFDGTIRRSEPSPDEDLERFSVRRADTSVEQARDEA